MDESQGGGKRKKAAEDLILRTIAAHADSLLRTARRHSICVDDAQDAYQRAIELFMSHAPRLDAARAPGWLHVVVKREAQAIQRSRRKILMSTEVDLDGHEADRPADARGAAAALRPDQPLGGGAEAAEAARAARAVAAGAGAQLQRHQRDHGLVVHEGQPLS